MKRGALFTLFLPLFFKSYDTKQKDTASTKSHNALPNTALSQVTKSKEQILIVKQYDVKDRLTKAKVANEIPLPRVQR